MRVMRLILLLSLSTFTIAQSSVPAKTPWQMQDSGTTAGLRGIDSVDGTIAWASGTGGTVLKTIDGGAHWQKCAVPDAENDGATLDFRGVQAWDANTAIVMASGPGEKSRLYKTTDGCRTWKLMLKNNDPEGFYDAFTFWDRKHGFLLGDPILRIRVRNEPNPLEYHAGQTTAPFVERTLKHRRFLTLSTIDGGDNWAYWGTDRGYFTEDVALDGAAFAASNSAAFVPFQSLPNCRPGPEYATSRSWIGVGGKGGARILMGFSNMTDVCAGPNDKWPDELRFAWSKGIPVPLAGGTDFSGVFSVGFRAEIVPLEQFPEGIVPNGRGNYEHGIAVGGDYTKPNESTGTAACSSDGGEHWTASTIPPHGFRSAVQWSEALKLWITVGTNGSDISRDDGKTWQLLDNGNWNALSLPFVVGPNGGIARLNPEALPPITP
jgi:photosystem II stability/assembly factor-like uncharacterized protein